MRTLLLTSLCLLGAPALARTPVARAFSDPERFTAPAEEGGAGGRFFTGSPSDGFSCVVCHSGGSPPPIAVRGLPMSGYTPGDLYEVELRFRNPAGNHAVALEVIDEGGRDLGLELLPDAEIMVGERCGGEATQERASYLTEQGTRRILGVEACEAKAVRFRFRAPNASQAWFVASVLASDSSATVDGDGVTEVAQAFYRRGSPPPSSENCSTRAALPSQSPWHPWLGAALLALFGRRRARRSRDRSAPVEP